MRVCRRGWGSFAGLFFVLTTVLLVATASMGQGAYQAQIRGTLTDQSGAVVAKATITITNDATSISQTATSDDHGQYLLGELRPAVYTIKVEASGFRVSEKKNVVLQVDQQTSVDFVLHPLGISETMEVTETAPLLDTESATLGTDISELSTVIAPRLPLCQLQLLWSDVSGFVGVTRQVAGSGTRTITILREPASSNGRSATRRPRPPWTAL